MISHQTVGIRSRKPERINCLTAFQPPARYVKIPAAKSGPCAPITTQATLGTAMDREPRVARTAGSQNSQENAKARMKYGMRERTVVALEFSIMTYLNTLTQ